MDEAFASRLNREDNRRAQTRRVAGLAKVKDVDRFRGVLAAVFVVSGSPSVDRICGYSSYMIPEIACFSPLTGELCHTIEPQKPGRRTEAFIPTASTNAPERAPRLTPSSCRA
jgi:hypothetical protein